MSSIPTYEEMNPRDIAWQWNAMQEITHNKTPRVQEYLLSGAVGSAKSVTLAYMVTRHCIRNPGAVVGIGRLAMPHLKETLLNVLLEHIPERFVADYNQTKGIIRLHNGSRIVPFSWSDKKYKKFRSHEFSMFVIDELTENDSIEFYNEIKMRVGRLRHVPTNECMILCATNPDSPAHWVHKYFMESDKTNRHVFYSLTKDNPFLPEGYTEQLEESLDERMIQRMLYGRWIEISGDVLYSQYDKAVNYKDEEYAHSYRYPIYISFDFNIASGKPLSLCVFAYRPDLHGGSFHFFNEVVVEGFRTGDALDEALGKGLFDFPTKIIVTGDATGRHKDTRSRHSDYTIIEDFLSNAKTRDGRSIDFEIDVPRANPPIRKRHNLVNGYCRNSKGQNRLFVYKTAPTVDEGLRLTRLVDGGRYIENDKDRFQHITTAIGYGIHTCLNRTEDSNVTMIAR